jgi:hypothetical protein
MKGFFNPDSFITLAGNDPGNLIIRIFLPNAIKFIRANGSITMIGESPKIIPLSNVSGDLFRTIVAKKRTRGV